jgi:hypothetical protein
MSSNVHVLDPAAIHALAISDVGGRSEPSCDLCGAHEIDPRLGLCTWCTRQAAALLEEFQG